MLRAVESGEAVGAVRPTWWDLTALTGIYLVYGNHAILVATKETQPLWIPREQL